MSKTQQAQNTETFSSPIMVPLNKLIEDPNNVRLTRSNDGIEALADNIHAEGLLQNLVVRKVKGGKFAVSGGERRRTALNLLVKQKEMKAAQPVPCLLVDEAHTSASLSENIHRMAMHPADEFAAWAKMQDDGLSIPEIVKRHGTTTRTVEQRLKLGRLSPVLLDALRNDEIDISTACAFTITDDHKRQEEVHEALKKRRFGYSANSVKSTLAGEEIASSNKLAQFVGRETYEQAGGEIRTDLFDEDVVYFKNEELLEKLATEKLEEEAERLKADGWTWIDIAFDANYRACEKMRKIHLQELVPLSAEDQAKKEKMEKRYEELEKAADNGDEAANNECYNIQEALDVIHRKTLAYKPEDKAISGGFLYLNSDGSFDLRLGYVRREDDPKIAAAKREAAIERAKMPSQLNKSLRSDLSALRREIHQTAFLKNPAIARGLLAFHTIRDVLFEYYTQTPFNLSAGKAKSADCISKAGDMGQFKGRTEAETIIAKLPLYCFEMKDTVKGFEAFIALPEDDKTALQAYAAMQMLEPQLSDDPSPDPTLERTTQLMSVDIAEHWTPNAEFFDRLTKNHMSEIAKKVINPAFVKRHEKDKKSAFAEAMGTAFNPDNKQSSISDKAAERASKWVPDCMAG